MGEEKGRGRGKGGEWGLFDTSFLVSCVYSYSVEGRLYFFTTVGNSDFFFFCISAISGSILSPYLSFYLYLNQISD